MPRTGGVYSPPAGTKGVSNTTIQSVPYNALVDDLTADANAARPITAGGTGATSASAARTALGADNADNLTSGTVNDARLPTTQGTKQIGLINLNNGQISRNANNSFLSISGGTEGNGANIELYGPSAGTPSAAFYDADSHSFRQAAGSGTPTVTIGPNTVWHAGNLVPNTGAVANTIAQRNASGTLVGYELTSAKSASNGRVNLGSNGAHYLEYDGSNYVLPSGALYVFGQMRASNEIYAGNAVLQTDGNIQFQSTMASTYGATLAAALSSKQNSLGFTPLQQGGGAGQSSDKVYIGHIPGVGLGLQIIGTDFATTWPIAISGNAASASNSAALGGVAAANFAQFSASTNTNETNFPIGQVLIVNTPSSTPARRDSRAIYLNGGDAGGYSTNAGASQLAGTWRQIGNISATYSNFQRVA
ncbi:hypothetical protein [Ensifer sp. ENS05]|uniref:hypothetical protein n=1 Tax=Ensifer sp. ENS05 TaxID=2769277 RepID=UPI001FF0513B|nr:hypothetical protein [Ensifer sp. ENS05]